MTDVLLFQTDDGGNVTFENGNPITADGLYTAVYLSLFGGNKRDTGSEATDSLQWWGNFDETESAKKYRSETQNIILGSTNLPSDMLNIQDAVGRDLQWMLDEDVASDIDATATVPGFNQLSLEVSITVGDNEFDFIFEVGAGG